MPFEIEHFVVLMMENRSFDHMLGFLKNSNANVNGLNGNESNQDDNGNIFKVDQSASYLGLDSDPGHEFPDVTKQIYGLQNPQPGDDQNMSGFVKSNGSVAMNCFSPKRIPVLSGLANHYAICDNWFSSVPGPTFPNRAFAHAATSNGLVTSEVDYGDLKTIYEEMDHNNISYRFYTYGLQSFLVSIKYLIKNQMAFRNFESSFERDCKAGNLPQYTWIEPRFIGSDDGEYPASDQHPLHDVRVGEAFIYRVYKALTSNIDHWNRTLFLIVYDEHGGFYDHVVPPTCPQEENAANEWNFKFDRMGVRVPAVLISPFISPGTIDSTPYDHSSIVKTIRNLFMHGTQALTKREDNAQSVYTNIEPLVATARTDNFELPKTFELSDIQNEIRESAPTELVKRLCQMIQNRLDEMNIDTTTSGNSIETVSDANAFFNEAFSALRGKDDN